MTKAVEILSDDEIEQLYGLLDRLEDEIEANEALTDYGKEQYLTGIRKVEEAVSEMH